MAAPKPVAASLGSSKDAVVMAEDLGDVTQALPRRTASFPPIICCVRMYELPPLLSCSEILPSNIKIPANKQPCSACAVRGVCLGRAVSVPQRARFVTDLRGCCPAAQQGGG